MERNKGQLDRFPWMSRFGAGLLVASLFVLPGCARNEVPLDSGLEPNPETGAPASGWDPNTLEECEESIGLGRADRDNPAILDDLLPGDPDPAYFYTWKAHNQEYLRAASDLAIPDGTRWPELHQRGVIDVETGDCVDDAIHQVGSGETTAVGYWYCLWQGAWLDAFDRGAAAEAEAALDTLDSVVDTRTWRTAWHVSVQESHQAIMTSARLGDRAAIAQDYVANCEPIHDQFPGVR